MSWVRPQNATEVDTYPPGFEEDEPLRSQFIRELTLRQLHQATLPQAVLPSHASAIPRLLVRYWHDHSALPDDVRACLDSWERLADEGLELRTYSDATAERYIAENYGARELKAFAACRHPAMRCDYMRLCVILAEGGFYVDADDVLLDNGWKEIFRDARLKLQPLCYDIPACGMVRAAEIWRTDLPTEGRVFYINNDPLAAPTNHPVIRRALTRATDKLLGSDPAPEIQSTTGPGNLTASLAIHARELILIGGAMDFELLRDWDAIAETRWELSYRGDARNWRNMSA